ncbi:Rieske (2Fe-2S) protein, partial [Streptomyces sp. 8N706]|uniref:Rieske (2Fe-2S) protein n=1 Tax=Streptomyces sp. 8N706 TaxID=3457416 RepID=UPI003FD212A3
YIASFVVHRRGHRQPGRMLAIAGYGVMITGAYLGGHLAFVNVVNVNRTAFEDRPGEWTPVLPDSDLAEGEHRKVHAGAAPVLLHRLDGQVLALSSTCSHMGGPLDQGEVADGCVTCPWHGSTFRLADGGIIRGPASTPQPAYETRLHDGQIEVRARED